MHVGTLGPHQGTSKQRIGHHILKLRRSFVDRVRYMYGVYLVSSFAGLWTRLNGDDYHIDNRFGTTAAREERKQQNFLLKIAKEFIN